MIIKCPCGEIISDNDPDVVHDVIPPELNEELQETDTEYTGHELYMTIADRCHHLLKCLNCGRFAYSVPGVPKVQFYGLEE